VQIQMHASTHQYKGPVKVTFEPDEQVEVALADGRTVDIFNDGTWQAWSPATEGEPRHLLVTGSFDETGA
jgi:hypothetical protein